MYNFSFSNLICVLFLACGLMLLSSCGSGSDSPCDEVICDFGFHCEEGVCIRDANTILAGFIDEDMTLTNDRVWELFNKVYVKSGVTLTIEPGTIIKGKSGVATQASALVIARGAKINACGTPTDPIIFTTIEDNIQQGQKAGSNLDGLDRAKWGGLIILGNAPISAKDGDTQAAIEGLPVNIDEASYGGTSPEDNSGTLCYVSIRHGGAEIGDGNEINGLTLGGVGSGTTIHHVEILSNLDDGIEFFGGTVSVDHVVVSFCGDDGLDIDQNYSGTVTNFVVFVGEQDGDNGLEIDGPENTTYMDGQFKLNKGAILNYDSDAGYTGAELKSGAQGSIEECIYQGFDQVNTVEAIFDANCNLSASAADNLLNQGKLRVSQSICSGAANLSAFYELYASRCNEATTLLDADAETLATDEGNSVANDVYIFSKVDITEFENWSWMDLNGYFN